MEDERIKVVWIQEPRGGLKDAPPKEIDEEEE